MSWLRLTTVLTAGIAVVATLPVPARAAVPSAAKEAEIQKADAEFAAEVRREQEPTVAQLEGFDLRQTTITLYTIDPSSRRARKRSQEPLPQPAGVPAFREWKILGSKVIPLQEEKKRLMAEFIRSCRETDGKVPPCFEPRHALRLESKERVVELVVCFHCRQAQVHGLDKRVDLSITETAEEWFNRLVGKYALRLAP